MLSLYYNIDVKYDISANPVFFFEWMKHGSGVDDGCTKPRTNPNLNSRDWVCILSLKFTFTQYFESYAALVNNIFRLDFPKLDVFRM